MSNYGRRSGSAKDEEQICKEKSVNELSVIIIIIIIITIIISIIEFLTSQLRLGNICSNQQD